MTKSMMSIIYDIKEDEMQEQFTKQAKEALNLAEKMARYCKHSYIGT